MVPSTTGSGTATERTQFCLTSSDEKEISGNVGSSSKVLRLPLTGIAGTSEKPSELKPVQLLESPDDDSSFIAKVIPAHESQKHLDDSESSLKREMDWDLPLRRSKRIRHTFATKQVRQTPMGLPKPLRLRKKEFTIEEIYLNKNYRTPPEKSLETIFEVPKEHKDGSIMMYARMKNKRKCTFSIDYNKKPAKSRKRKGYKVKHFRVDANSDELLKQKLSRVDNDLALAGLSP